MKKSMKRILCGVLSLGLCTTLVAESVLRSNAKGTNLGITTANASFKDVTGMFDTSKMREANFNDSVLKAEDVAPVYETRTVLITLSGNPLVDRASGEAVDAYMNTFSGEVAKSEIAKEQANFLQALKQKGIPYKVEHTYNAVTNGVAVELDTKYVSEIKQMKGVDSVVITTAYALPTAAEGEDIGSLTNETTVRETGIYDSDAFTKEYGSGVKNYGTGTVVAVLDTGLDYTHDAFQTFLHQNLAAEDIAWSREEVANKIATLSLSAEERSGSLEVSDVYLSAKVPFAYDYADDDADVYPSYSNHGTHVAGIIGGYDPNGYTNKDGVNSFEREDLPAEAEKRFIGVVPDAQLMICKVFTDDLDDKDLGGAVSEDIVAALDDCVKLGVDVINMSLGSSCGFTTTNDGDDEGQMLNEVYTRIGEAGISLICAASNDYSAGYGGVYGTNLASNPDAGTVGSPSTFASALSVASINGQKASYLVANSGTANQAFVFFEEARDINSNPMEFVKSMTNGDGQEHTFEYVVIPGVGEGKDYSSKAVAQLKAGRLALVKRGETSFEEKVRLAKSMGASGIIIYNNVAGTIRMNLGEIENPIPAVSISMNAGNAMVKGANSEGIGKITMKADYSAGPFMSEFSSWGPTPDLHLKPEITAHGGEITSAVPGGYGEQSGTSMATPNMAGFMAVVRSYLTQEHIDLITDDGVIDTPAEKIKLNELAMNLTMSTAGVVKDQDGLPYSPRKQGAGVAKLENVVNGTNAYLYTDEHSSSWENSNTDGRPKVELGDMLHEQSEITFSFYVNNFGSAPLTFQPQFSLMTETLSSDNLTVSEQAHLLTSSTVKFYDKNGEETSQILVGVGESDYKVTVKIRLGDKDRRYIEDSFENGMYVEGFVNLVSQTSGQCDLNLPFMGFYGDWDQAPMLDYSAYEVAENAQDSSILEEDKIKASVWATQPYNIYYNDKYVLPMGGYLYLLPDDADPMYVDEEHNAVSRYNDYYGEGNVNNYMTSTGIKAVYAGLLRNARYVKYRLIDESTGEVLQVDYMNRVAKAYAGGGSAVPANVKLELYPEEEGFIANGRYRMEFEFFGEGYKFTGDEKDFEAYIETLTAEEGNTFSFSFTVDYEAPTLEQARVRFENYKDGNKEKQRVLLDIDVFDNHYAQTLMLCYPKTEKNGDVTVQLLTDYPTPIRNATKNGITTVSIDITDVYEKYGSTLYLQIDDYALNTCLYQLDINQANANTLPDGDTFALAEGEDKISLDIYGTHKTQIIFAEEVKGDADASNLLWKSNNPNVAIVKNGEIVGVGEGTTKVLVNNRKGEQKSIEVTVSGNRASLTKIPSVEFGVIQTDTDSWQKATGEVKVNAGKDLTLDILTDPWYHPMTDLNIRWESKDTNVATVEPSADGKSAVIHTLKKGTVRITAVIQEKTSTGAWKDTKYNTVVNLRVQKEFSVSNFTLNDYNGLGYNEENGILRIPTDMNIMYIGEEAFKENDTIKKIIIPSSVVEIRPRAFLDCTALEEVYFVDVNEQEIADADVSMIYENAFSGCINLKKIDFRNVKTVTIAQDCFSGCTKLEEVLGMPKIGTMHHRAFAGTALKEVDLSGLHMSGTSVFEGCKSLTTITNTSKFSAIGKYMFRNCTSLVGDTTTKVQLLKTPKIGEGAFSGCTALEKVEIDSSVQGLNIGVRAFENCGTTSEEDFSIAFNQGSSVYAIGEKAFVNSTLSSFDFTTVNGLEILGENVFTGTKVTSITLTDSLVQVTQDQGGNPVYTYVRLTGIPFEKLEIHESSQYFEEDNGTIYDIGKKTILYVNASVAKEYTVEFDSVVAIGDYAFAGSNISSFTLSENIERIGVGAFENSTLTGFSFGNNEKVTEIPASAFEGSYLVGITLPANVEKIGAYAFANSDLANFALASGSKVNAIGSYAFSGCEALQDIDMSQLTLTGTQERTMGDYVFLNCTALESANLPSVTEMGAFTFLGASKLERVIFGDKSTTTGTFTLGGNDTTITSSYVGAPVKNVTLPSAVTKLDMGVFNRCTELESIDLRGVVEIGDFAFNGSTSLKTVVGLEDVKTFGTQAFYSTALESLDLSAATHIGYMAFGLHESTAEENKYTAITLENVQEIGDFAFFNGGESSVQIPVSLQKIGVGVFASSDKLTQVTVKDDDSAYFESNDGVLYRKTKVGASDEEQQYELVCYPTARLQTAKEGTEEKVYAVKEGTVRIQAYAFAYLNTNMVDHVVLPYSIKTIGDSAFFVSDIGEYTFESIVAPTLEATYRAEVRDAIAEDAVTAAYKGYYYTNFQTYLYHFTNYGTQKVSPLIMHYPCNGTGYTNPIYSKYFGTSTPSEAPLPEDNTREFLKIVAKLPTLAEVKAMMNWDTSDESKLAYVQNLSDTMKTARSYYNNAMKNEGQKVFITEEDANKLLGIEEDFRAVKKRFGIKVAIQQLLIAEDSTHRTQYLVGETFDMTGLSIIVEYDDYSTEVADFKDLKLITTGALAEYMETVDVAYKDGTRVRIGIKVLTELPVTEDGKGSGNHTWIIVLSIVGGVLVLGGVAVGVFFLVKRKGKAKTQAVEEETVVEDAPVETEQVSEPTNEKKRTKKSKKNSSVEENNEK